MAKEERYITFDLGEIYIAVDVLSKRDTKYPVPPRGAIKSIGLKKEGAKNIFLIVHNEDTGQEETLEYGQDFFSMALVLLCQANKIPLPRSGTKTLKVLEDKMIMQISLESITAVPA